MEVPNNITIPDFQVEHLPVRMLKKYGRNAKKHPAEQVERIKKSILEFGFRNPIILNNLNSKEIVAGHGRLMAAKELGMSTVPCVSAEDLTEGQIKAFRIMDNKSQESDWDYELLQLDFADLNELGYDLDLTGFDPADYEGGESNVEVKEDDFVPDLEKEPEYIVNKGDVYALGNHRLMCGDSTVKENIDILMDGKKADMVFTDPPYGMNLDTNFGEGMGQHGIFKSNKNYSKVIGDNEDFTKELILNIFNNFSYCKEIILFGADYFAELLPRRKEGSWFVWDKKEQGKEFDFTLSEFELCWSKNKHSRKIIRVPWRGIIGLGTQDTKKRIHPTQKPLELLIKIINRIDTKKILTYIVDLFGGSGSTLIACEQLNRKCYMMELDPKYCSVIIERWEKLTGKEAVKTGE